MNFEVLREEFLKALIIGTRSMMSRASLPILSNVLLRVGENRLEIVTTSLETAVKVGVVCSSKQGGEVAVSGRVLLDFVSQLSGKKISFEKLGEELLVSSDGTSARFATMASEEFPAIPKVEGGKKLTIDAGEISRALSKVFFCAAQDESRPILAGVLFEGKKEGLVMVATDGFRLGYSTMKITPGVLQGVKVVIPARAVGEISKIVSDLLGEGESKKNIEIIIADNLNQAVFKIEEVEFTTRLIDGSYPVWDKLVPSTFSTNVAVNKEKLSRSMKVAAIFAKEAGNIIKLKITSDGKEGLISVSSNTAQVGSSDSKVEAKMTGVGGEIAFNFRYVLEALATIEGEMVVFEMNESLNPGRLKPVDDETFSHIIMPVRLQG